MIAVTTVAGRNQHIRNVPCHTGSGALATRPSHANAHQLTGTVRSIHATESAPAIHNGTARALSMWTSSARWRTARRVRRTTLASASTGEARSRSIAVAIAAA